MAGTPAAFDAGSFENAAFQTGESADTVTPTGGWSFPPDYGRSAEDRRKERERLKITEREQRKIDRAAKAIALRVGDDRSPVAVETEIAHAREFDKLIADITARNTAVMEGLALLLMQSLQARILEELRDEDDAIAMLLMEM